MIVRLIILLIFNLVYTLNNYSEIFNLIIINILLFLFEFLIIRKNNEINKKNLIFSLFISIILIINNNSLIYGYENKKIIIENSNEKVFKINSIYLNNQKVILSNEKNVSKNPYDIYNKLTANYSLNVNNIFEIETKKKRSVIINFEKYNYEYDVLINNNKIKVPKSVINRESNYYKVYDNFYTYEISNVNFDNEYVIMNIIISLLGLTIILLSVINSIKKQNLIPFFLALSIILFEFNDLILIDIVYKILLFVIILGICNLLRKINILKKIENRKSFVLNMLINIIITFMFIGNLYLDNKLSIYYLLIYIFFTIWISFIVLLLKEKIKKFSNFLIKKEKCKFLDKVLLFIIPLLVFFAYLYIFKPFIITTDGDMQLGEIYRNYYTNWHPYFHTILMYYVYNIFKNFTAFIIIRIIILSLIISSIGSYFIKRGINKKFIYLIIFVFCLNPVNGIYVVSILKDVDYVIFLILLTFLIIKYINKDLKNSFFNCLLLFMSLLFVALFRHNGVYVSVLTSIFLIVIIIKNKNIKFIITMFITIIFIILFNTKFYKYYEINPGLKNTDIVALFHGLQSISVEVDDEEVRKMVKKYVDINEYYDSYNKYNIDVLLHYNEIQFRNIEVNKLKVIKLYLKKMLKYPSILISDRLYGTDIIWNVFKNDKVQTYDYQIFENEFGFEYYSDYKIKFENNKLKNFISNILLFMSSNRIFNSLFLRSGIYLVFLLILLNYYKSKTNIIVLFPCIINLLTFFLTLHHQSYRYVMFIPILFIIYFLHVITSKDKD